MSWTNANTGKTWHKSKELEELHIKSMIDVQEMFTCRLTSDMIRQHFIVNQTWRDIFELHYPNCSETDVDASEYVKRAWKIFESNGFTYTMTRYSDNPKSTVYTAVRSIELYKGEEEICNRANVPASTAVEQLLIEAITGYRIDCSKFNRNTSLARTLTSARQFGL